MRVSAAEEGSTGERHQAKRREQRRRATQEEDPLEALRERIDESIGCGDLDLVRRTIDECSAWPEPKELDPAFDSLKGYCVSTRRSPHHNLIPGISLRVWT